MSSGLLRKISRRFLTSDGGSALERAEQLGKVELKEWFGSRMACIEVGQYHDCQLQVWGSGETSEQALEAAISKMQAIRGALGEDMGA